MPIKSLLSASFLVALLAPAPAQAQQSTTPAEAEIRIGNLMPYTGMLAPFAASGRAQAAYFDMINERGGINERKIPQLFIASGGEEWAHPRQFPWTMGWQPAFRAEGRIFANYIQAAYADRKIAVLWENDQFGRDLFRGLREGLGDTASLIVADIAFDVDDNSVDGQIEILKDSGAEILVFN